MKTSMLYNNEKKTARNLSGKEASVYITLCFPKFFPQTDFKNVIYKEKESEKHSDYIISQQTNKIIIMIFKNE